MPFRHPFRPSRLGTARPEARRFIYSLGVLEDQADKPKVKTVQWGRLREEKPGCEKAGTIKVFSLGKKAGARDVLRPLPWHFIRARNRRLPLILDVKGLILDPTPASLR